ncbi:hypothetical protein LVY74_16480 [Acinetobacter sp. ME22]|uniref:hypothetical protein n=1 Tax=Acinetobacter sp. ME22 TaxID=2904802 RepID=UPI001EDB0748|nr:hypothetical protein [Acinetobacter sp. ME22]MCG2575134.1 hypothetical protein [Acinetobacter sp. ME22]
MKADIKELLEEIFPPFPLGDNHSLFECDFLDSERRYFEDVDDDYLSRRGLSEETLILKYRPPYWPEFYCKVGLEAIRSRSRAQEGIKTWKDVGYEYLYYFGINCWLLSSEGFKFFLPAAFYYFLSAGEDKPYYMDFFIFRFDSSQWEEDCDVFNDDQKNFIREFIEKHYPD